MATSYITHQEALERAEAWLFECSVRDDGWRLRASHKAAARARMLARGACCASTQRTVRWSKVVVTVACWQKEAASSLARKERSAEQQAEALAR